MTACTPALRGRRQLALIALGLVASYVPARASSWTSPLEALRAQ